jgi:hypothetical protein
MLMEYVAVHFLELHDNTAGRYKPGKKPDAETALVKDRGGGAWTL